MKPLALALALITTVAPLASAVAAPIDDDFNDNAVNTSLWNAAAVGTGASFAEVNQRVEISIAGDASGTFGAGYGSVALLDGDIDVAVSFSVVDWPATNGTRVTLQLATAGGNSYWEVERVSGGGMDQFGEVYLTDFNSSVGNFIPTTDTTGALRIARTGTVISAYYLAGGQWQFMRSSDIGQRELFLGFGAFSSDEFFGNQPVRIAFDNLATVPLPATAIPLLTGLLSLLGFFRDRRGKPASPASL